MAQSVRRCGRCGQVGHNRQTCGRVSSDKAQRKRVRGKSGAEPARSAKKVGTLDDVWERIRPAGKVSADGDVPAEGMAADEFDTWWQLAGSGRDGKVEKPVGGWGMNRSKPPVWDENDTDKVMSILKVAAKNTNVRPAAAKNFLSRFGAAAKVEMAMRDDLPLVFLVALSKDPSVGVRWRIAEREDTPSEVLAMMARVEKKHAVSIVLAGNPNTPVETLKEMFHRREWYAQQEPSFSGVDTEGSVANSLLGNPNLPTVCVLEGVRSKKFFTYRAALCNSRVPSRVLKAEWDKSFIDGPGGIVDGSTWGSRQDSARSEIVRNPNCPERIMWQAAGEEMAEDMTAVCLWSNPRLSRKVAARAWENATGGGRKRPPAGVIWRMVDNPSVPRRIIDDAMRNGWVSSLDMGKINKRLQGG